LICKRALSHCNITGSKTWRFSLHDAIIRPVQVPAGLAFASPRIFGSCDTTPSTKPLATEQELNDFLKSVEKRAFKRSVYHVRNEESALDIVQDSMMKLAEHYGDKPAAELPMLFQRILSNCTLDWFRRQKTRNALFSNMGDFESASEDGEI
jgi:hypothetical protein